METKKPMISIVTVVLNGAEWLERCIQSVHSQEYLNKEHILIDGGSTDGTLEIAEKYRNDFSYFSSGPDAGISEAFNKGITASRGSIIGFLNADDYYEKGVLSKVAHEIGGSDIYFGNMKRLFPDGSYQVAEADDKRLLQGMSLNHPACFITKSALDKYGKYDMSFHCAMDYELLLRMKVGGASFTRTKAVLSAMQWGGKSERNFALGLKEVKRAKEMHLGKSVSHHMDYYAQWLRTRVSLALRSK